MENIQSGYSHDAASINWGHFASVVLVMVLLLGVTWMKQPQLFILKSSTLTASSTGLPHYYAYVTPPEDKPQPQVAGATTNPGPSVINEDGSVSPIDMGQVLGASTQDVTLSLDDVKVPVVIPDSDAAIKKYFADVKTIENGPIDGSEFESALSSGDQNLIDAQAKKLTDIRDALQKVSVPQGLVKLFKLTILQYNSAIGVLQNFTQADNNPQLVGNFLQNFLKSQQDLDSENVAVEQKYNLDLGYDPAAVQAQDQANLQSLQSVSAQSDTSQADLTANNGQ